MKFEFSVASLAAICALYSAPIHAHVGVISGPAFAASTQEIAFGVGHGCEGADTISVRVEIPPDVTSVRTLDSDLGAASLELDDAGLVTAVTWEKPEEQRLGADTAYYRLSLRIKVPDQPFTTLYFPAHQSCVAADGSLTTVDWVATPADGATGEAGEPAPELAILPKRRAGWNRIVAPVAIDDLSRFFDDALIVWSGEAAFSSNPSTVELIAATPGVTSLSAIAEGDELWVRY